jgi:hypothetical protein
MGSSSSFTSPMGRGRRVAPGEGLEPIESSYPLTPTLSPWEREFRPYLRDTERKWVSLLSEVDRILIPFHA